MLHTQRRWSPKRADAILVSHSLRYGVAQPVKAIVLGLALLVLSSAGCATSPALRSSLEQSATADAAGATVAVSVRDLATGERASVHGDIALPMMSVFKLPLAVAALDAVDRGEFTMAQPIPITEGEVQPETPLAELWKNGEHAPTLEVVLRLMLQQSDNTAGDKMLSVLGGGPKVTSRLRGLDVQGIDIREPEINISARLFCVGASTPPGGWTSAAVDACPEPTEADRVSAARHEISASPNAATTDGVVALLGRIDEGGLLSVSSRQWLLATLEGTVNGPKRIKGLLPAGTPVAHKPGTGGLLPGVFVATNDVGIVTLPTRRRFAIAVFVVGSSATVPQQELVIAKVARAAWDALVAR